MAKEYPPPIISTEPGTWAHSTIVTRLPAIAARVIEENEFSREINQALTTLQEDIPEDPVRYLKDKGSPDHEDWQGYIKPYLDRDWLTIPWFFAEHYFYRRIMEAVDYFNLRVDPFQYRYSHFYLHSIFNRKCRCAPSSTYYLDWSSNLWSPSKFYIRFHRH